MLSIRLQNFLRQGGEIICKGRFTLIMMKGSIILWVLFRIVDF